MSTKNSMLIDALQDPDVYPHPVDSVKLIETHISWVLLTGPYAYKIKKPVNFGFLDFSTLEKRHFYCEEELRLNKRLAPELYLELVNITGSPDRPEINGDRSVIEYAVKMLQFPQSCQLDNVLSCGELTVDTVDLMAKEIARFHARCEVADEQSRFGALDAVRGPVIENFEQIKQQHLRQADIDVLQAIQTWSESACIKLGPELLKRKQNGFIRECHGDMHLRNMVLLDGKFIAFDCLEFNDELRWIDVMSEIAFVCMDLDDRNKSNYSRRLLNAYLEFTGDYAGVNVLRFYLVYRAMVRAKVNVLRLSQSGLNDEERDIIYDEFKRYLQLAGKYTGQQKPVLYITHGLSGSGKTTGTQSLIEEMGVIRLRSDVERKRLFDVATTKHDVVDIGGGIYNKQASERTYAYLKNQARSLLMAGWSVVIDATFLRYGDRKSFFDLADDLHVPFIILSFNTPVDILKQRLYARMNAGNDASDANIKVLESQRENNDPLNVNEYKNTILITANVHLNAEKINNRINYCKGLTA